MTEYRETEPECKGEVIGKEIRPGIFFPLFLGILGSQRARVGEQRKGAFSTQMTVKRNVGENTAERLKVSGYLNKNRPPDRKQPGHFSSVFLREPLRW